MFEKPLMIRFMADQFLVHLVVKANQVVHPILLLNGPALKYASSY